MTIGSGNADVLQVIAATGLMVKMKPYMHLSSQQARNRMRGMNSSLIKPLLNIHCDGASRQWRLAAVH